MPGIPESYGRRAFSIKICNAIAINGNSKPTKGLRTSPQRVQRVQRGLSPGPKTGYRHADRCTQNILEILKHQAG